MRTKLLFSKSAIIGVASAVTTASLLLGTVAFAQFGPSNEDIQNMVQQNMPQNMPSGPGGPGGMMGPGGPGGMMGPDSFGPGGQNDPIGPGGPGGFGPGGSNFGPGGPGGMMGPGGPGGMMGPGGEGNMGPSEEQMEEMQKKGQQMQVKGMYSGMKQGIKGMSQGVKMMKNALTKLAKQGITAPEELTAAIAKVEEMAAYMSSIKSASDITDADAFMEKMSDMAEVGSVMSEWGPRMGDLFRMAQMTKEAEKRLKQINKDVKKAKTAATKSKMDLTDQITELDTAAATLQQALDDAKGKTDPDEKQDAVDAFFEQVDNIYDTINLINSLKNLGRAKQDWTRQVKLNDTEIKRLTRKKLDIDELKTVQNDLKSKLAELSSALTAKPIDSDSLVDLMEEAKDLQSQFDDARDQLLGTESELPQVKVEKFNTPKMDFSMFSQFKKSEPASEDESGL